MAANNEIAPIASQDRENLLHTTRRLLAEVQALSSRIAAVNEIATAINKLLNLNDILRVVGKQAKWLMDFSHCSVCLRQPDGTITPVALFGKDDAFDYFSTDSSNPILRALESGQAQMTQNDHAPDGEYSSKIVIALESQKEVIGTLNFAQRGGKLYTQEDIRIGYLLALQLSSAIRNAWRFEELRQLNIQLDEEKQHTEAALKEVENLLQNLRAVNVELVERDREKNEFLGIVAHDLKNPLAGIAMTAAFLKDYSESISEEKKTEQIGRIYATAIRMNHIVGNLLNVNAIESGKIHFSLEAVDLTELSAALIEEYTEKAARKEITLHPLFKNDACIITADRNSLYEVLENLLSNAIKYSPREKNIFVEIQTNGVAIVWSVCDEGPGLTEEDKSKVFGKFTRLSARPTAGEDSTGLGLSIVKKLTEAMGGKVWCESEHGFGATFFVEFRVFKR